MAASSLSEKQSKSFINFYLFFLIIIIFGAAFMRVYIRVQTTLLGYEIGKLKNDESRLLQERSELRLVHAQLTTRESLEKLSKFNEAEKNIEQKSKTTY